MLPTDRWQAIDHRRPTTSSEILAWVDASAGALARGDHRQARTSLLMAARGLYNLASESAGNRRIDRVLLAGRLCRQAALLEPPRFRNEDRPVPKPAGPTPGPTISRLDEVVGCEEIKAVFRSKFIYPLRNPELAQTYRQDGGGGVLLYGLPGTGKTMLVRALTGELGVPTFAIKPAEILSKWLGDSEKQLAELFGKARQHPAALIFIDEIEALAPSRDGDENHGAMRRLLTQLLTELDGFERKPGKLLFIGATNRPWDVDAALLRGGRFDALVYVTPPEAEARERLLREALTGIPVAGEVDCAELSRHTEGCTGAELRSLAALAAQMAFLDAVERGGNRPVRSADLNSALARIHRVASPEMLRRFELFAGKHSGDAPPLIGLDQPPAPIGPPEDGVEPLRFVSARDLAADLDLMPFICYALQHAGINPVRKLTITNSGREESQNLLVEVALIPEEFGAAWTCNIPELAAGASYTCDNISLPLSLDRLRMVREKELAHLRITVRDKEEVLLARTEEVPVLAYNEWLFLPEFMELTAAFVQSNAPALHPIVELIAARMETMTGSRALPGYQQNSPDHVRLLLQAVHQTLADDYPLDYINPPPSFEKTGQKLRLVADTITQRRGTCLDLAVLQAALWEHIGLHPCLVLVPGHAFMACWLKERHPDQPVVRLDAKGGSAAELLTELGSGMLLPVNSVEITDKQSFEQAVENGRQHLDRTLKQSGAAYVIDIYGSRRRVNPLP